LLSVFLIPYLCLHYRVFRASSFGSDWILFFFFTSLIWFFVIVSGGSLSKAFSVL
jgi:hypothetical protein